MVIAQILILQVTLWKVNLRNMSVMALWSIHKHAKWSLSIPVLAHTFVMALVMLLFMVCKPDRHSLTTALKATAVLIKLLILHQKAQLLQVLQVLPMQVIQTPLVE
jgi:hypothetical protein